MSADRDGRADRSSGPNHRSGGGRPPRRGGPPGRGGPARRGRESDGDRASPRNAERKPERKADRRPEREGERTPERKADRRPDREGERTPERTPERKADRRPERRPDPKSDRGRGRQPDRVPRGNERADKRSPSQDQARAAALDLLTAVRERAAYANLALPPILADRGLHGRDAALATELAYGACRALGQLDAIAEACGNRSLSQVDGPVLDALRLGVYQLLHTRVPPHAAVSSTVALVQAGTRPQAAGYVNAVLRKVSQQSLDDWVEELAPAADTEPLARIALRTAHPRWIVAALADSLDAGSGHGELAGDSDGGSHAGGSRAGGGRADDELRRALDADHAPAAMHLVARPGRVDRDDLARECGGEPGRYSPYAVYLERGNPSYISSIKRGAAAVQDEGSQLVACATANASIDGADTRWLDLTAGPGGKAALLGAIAAERGAHVDAVEQAEHRANLVANATKGLPVRVHTADGREPGLEHGSFDRVLVDVPCTGLGALRRRPEARWRRTEADVGPLVKLQRELLASAARLVRPGGVVVYSTCSPHLAETTGVIERRPAELELVDVRDYFPGVPLLGAGPTVQLWPHRQGTDGMFCALLRRTR